MGFWWKRNGDYTFIKLRMLIDCWRNQIIVSSLCWLLLSPPTSRKEAAYVASISLGKVWKDVAGNSLYFSYSYHYLPSVGPDFLKGTHYKRTWYPCNRLRLTLVLESDVIFRNFRSLLVILRHALSDALHKIFQHIYILNCIICCRRNGIDPCWNDFM